MSVKLNAVDSRQKGGSDDDCLQIARWPDVLDIDLLDISGGSHRQPRSWG